MQRPGDPGSTHKLTCFSLLRFPFLVKLQKNTVSLHLCTIINLLPCARNKQMRCEMRCPSGLVPYLLEARPSLKLGY